MIRLIVAANWTQLDIIRMQLQVYHLTRALEISSN